MIANEHVRCYRTRTDPLTMGTSRQKKEGEKFQLLPSVQFFILYFFSRFFLFRSLSQEK